MHKCPKCGSFNTRRSRHHVSQNARRSPFPAWFRCRDCRTRFLRTDWFLAGRWAALVVILGAAIAVVLWVSFRGDELAPETRAWNPSSAPLTAPTPMYPLEGASTIPIEALTAAAEAGDSATQYRLGAALFREYQEQGSRTSLHAALRWLTAAADQGHGLAQLQLGRMYEQGRGVIQDYIQAFEWYRQAAEQGQAEAMLRLGTMYQAGRGVPKDLVAAYIWLNLAAARGNSRAELPRDEVRILIPNDQITDAQSRSRALDGKLPRP